MPIPRSGTAGLGVVLYLAGVAMFAVNDALGKWLVKDYGVGQLMLLRTLGAGVVLAPMVLSLRVKLIDPRRPGLQVLRVLCAAADTFAFYYATRTMPLADVMTFYMATPLIVTALSAPLLGEKVERFRWIGRSGRLRWRPHRAEAFAPDALLGRAHRAVRSGGLCAEPDDHARSSGHPLGPARSLAIRRHGSGRSGDHSLGVDDARSF
jgi:uncharacterized membrane protein